MKSIHQHTQLSDNELKAVLRGDDITYGQLVAQIQGHDKDAQCRHGERVHLL